jgi:hypothetical protein
MDRCARYADANLIWPKRGGGSVFNPKHSRRFSEFVVDDSSHMNLSAVTGAASGPRPRGDGPAIAAPGRTAAVITGLPEPVT